jgi:raffinose/stachyose/melibiose transport system substrate-binding protein
VKEATVMRSPRRRWRLLTGAVALAVILGGCSGGNAGNGKVTLTWWHNATADPGKSFWQQIANEYHAKHPNVTIKVVPVQNEQFTTKIPVALQSKEPPDLFQQWGGGQLADQVKAGRVLEITSQVRTEVASMGEAAKGWQVDGKQYALPYSLGVVGFWYNKDMFGRAGITGPPSTWDDFITDIGRLKAAKLTPIALGGKDRWPDAFYWDYLATRACSKQTMDKSAKDYDFGDPCWTSAGDKVKQLLGAKPFQNGFLATPAQQGAGSSAGLLANGKAAMELQGHWNPGVMQGLTPNKKIGINLGWFPFPALPDGQGSPDAALGGGDGFSCSYKAPPQCVDFLKYIVSPDVQKRWAGTGAGLPTVKSAVGGVTDPNLTGLIAFRDKASYVQLYLDIAYATSVGQALDDATADQFAGTKNPSQVVKAIADAAKNR